VTPIITQPGGRRGKLSIAGAALYRWDGQRANLAFQTLEGDYDTPAVISFLLQLHRTYPCRRLIVVWDRLGAHQSEELRDFLVEGRTWRWLDLEQLPPYAPDLNPVDWVWSHFKRTSVANLCPADFRELCGHVDAELAQLHQRTDLAQSAIKHVRLFF